MATGSPVTLGARIVEQGERTIGASGHSALISDGKPRPCSRVHVGAPTADHTKAGVNAGRVLVGAGTTAVLNKSGARSLSVDNELGFDIPIDDANTLYLTGAAGDRVEYIIFG